MREKKKENHPESVIFPYLCGVFLVQRWNMKKYRKIGERFSTSKGTFEVVEGHCTDGCVFWTGKNNPLSCCRINGFARMIFGECGRMRRKDGKNVCFLLKTEESVDEGGKCAYGVVSPGDDDKLASEAFFKGVKIVSPEGFLIGNVAETERGISVEFVKDEKRKNTR